MHSDEILYRTTLMTAVAISTNVNGDRSFRGIELVSVVIDAVPFHGKNYSVYQMYDPLYPQMSTIYCLGLDDTYPTSEEIIYTSISLLILFILDWNCVVNIGNSYGFPIFIHRGANLTYPERCV